MPPEDRTRLAKLLSYTVICIAVVGYFVGLQSPMGQLAESTQEQARELEDNERTSGSLPATFYADMPSVTRSKHATTLANLSSQIDPLVELNITEADKSRALQSREQNRAFNGAPPTIPHPVDQHSAQVCLACHGDGVKTATLRIPKMSHQFLSQCTQCHVESNPPHMRASLFRGNTFVGMPAPTGGSRAFPGAPPQIPHTTWMRKECMSCHGFAGHLGIRTTHPWRKNCQQCHAPSSELDQTLLAAEPAFLPPPEIE